MSIQSEVRDGNIFLSGKVEEPEEKIKITKMAWETKGVRSVKNAITIKGQSNFKSTAKDILITSQLRSALIFNKKTKARTRKMQDEIKNHKTRTWKQKRKQDMWCQVLAGIEQMLGARLKQHPPEFSGHGFTIGTQSCNHGNHVKKHVKI